MLMYQDFGI